MRLIIRCLVFVSALAVLVACSALQLSSGRGARAASPSPASASSSAPTDSASVRSSVWPTLPSEPAPLSSAAGYVDPDLAAQLAEKCQVAGTISYYFVIPEGSSFQTIFPNAGKTPELDGRNGLFVAVYAGDVQILNYSGGAWVPGWTPSFTFHNVVCVVPAAGEVEVYSDVSHQGMTLPPGAQSGPPPTIAP